MQQGSVIREHRSDAGKYGSRNPCWFLVSQNQPIFAQMPVYGRSVLAVEGWDKTLNRSKRRIS
jgi:hypothetical protein